MEMTHPDILKMERYGTLEPNEEEEKIVGKCACCGEDVSDDRVRFIKRDMVEKKYFCSKECLCEYYEIEEVV